MLTNHKQIENGLIKHIREVLDGLLSEMPSELGSMPSVIKDRSKAPRPNFPYIVVDNVKSAKQGGSWLRDQYIDNVNVVHYKSEQRVTVKIRCYGEDPFGILNQLRVFSTDDRIRANLNNETGATFQYYTDISERPMFIETDFIDGAQMEVFFVAVSDWANPYSSTIESVELTGNYQDSEESSDIVVIPEITKSKEILNGL